MKETVLLYIAYVYLFPLFGSSSELSCGFTWRNVSYDLHPLTLTSGGQAKFYKVLDRETDVNNVQKNFTYLFNICSQVLQYPDTACRDDNDDWYCEEGCIDNSSLTCNDESGCKVNITEKAFAYQTRKENNKTKCNNIASANEDDYFLSLLDDDDPAAGVVLTYTNGDFCGSPYGRNRQFNIRFECENDQFNIPDNERLVEDPHCIYNLTIPSIYGCPTECGIYAYSLCGSQGLCGYDWSNSKAKCFCYHQYSGNDCSEYSDDDVYPDTKDTPTESDWVVTFTYEQTLTAVDGTTYDGSVDVTYDLTDFHLIDENFVVQDVHFHDTDPSTRKSFEYYFNVLDNVDKDLLPKACENLTDGVAFQYNNETNKCNLLAQVGSEDDYEFSLLDEENPARGIVLTYLNGTSCGEQSRNFIISFQCPDSTRDFYLPAEEATIVEYVDETHTCSYYITVETALACPYECITDVYENGEVVQDKFGVCGQRGMCAADPSAGIVRCLCDDGWTGADCNTETKYATGDNLVDNHTGFQVAIAVISIVLIAVVGIAVYLRMRYKTLEKNYLRQALVDDAEEDSTNQGPLGGQIIKNDDSHSDDEDDQSDAAVGDATQQHDSTDDDDSDDRQGGTTNNHDDLVVEDLDEHNDSD